MKTSQLAVILLIVCISSAVALKCNRCVPQSRYSKCTRTEETCERVDEVCASVVYSFQTIYSHFRRCMKRSDAFILQTNPNFQVFTCETDLCN